MAEVKRYEMVERTRGMECWDELERDQDGTWMRYEDHACIAAELAQARQALAAREEFHNLDDVLRLREAERLLREYRSRPWKSRMEEMMHDRVTDAWLAGAPGSAGESL